MMAMMNHILNDLDISNIEKLLRMQDRESITGYIQSMVKPSSATTSSSTTIE